MIIAMMMILVMDLCVLVVCICCCDHIEQGNNRHLHKWRWSFFSAVAVPSQSSQPSDSILLVNRIELDPRFDQERQERAPKAACSAGPSRNVCIYVCLFALVCLLLLYPPFAGFIWISNELPIASTFRFRTISLHFHLSPGAGLCLCT